jgi:hypothetical protein
VLSDEPGSSGPQGAEKDRQEMLAMEKQAFTLLNEWWAGSIPDAPTPEAEGER